MKLLHAVFCLIGMLGLSNAMNNELHCNMYCSRQFSLPHCYPEMSPQRMAECQLLSEPYYKCVTKCNEQLLAQQQNPDWRYQNARRGQIAEQLRQRNQRRR